MPGGSSGEERSAGGNDICSDDDSCGAKVATLRMGGGLAFIINDVC
jgi:hypothetical protein